MDIVHLATTFLAYMVVVWVGFVLASICVMASHLFAFLVTDGDDQSFLFFVVWFVASLILLSGLYFLLMDPLLSSVTFSVWQGVS